VNNIEIHFICIGRRHNKTLKAVGEEEVLEERRVTEGVHLIRLLYIHG
jgi:hypothetical protein